MPGPKLPSGFQSSWPGHSVLLVPKPVLPRHSNKLQAQEIFASSKSDPVTKSGDTMGGTGHASELGQKCLGFKIITFYCTNHMPSIPFSALYIIVNSHNTLWCRCFIIPLSQIRKLKNGEVRQCAQICTAWQRQSQDSVSNSEVAEAMTVTTHHIAHQNSHLLPPSPEPPRVLGVGFDLRYCYLHILFRVQKVTPVSLQTQHREAN